MIFLDTNVISETLRKTPNSAVIAWLTRHDAELALATITIAEMAYGIGNIRPDPISGLRGWSTDLPRGAIALPTGFFPSRTLRR